MITSTLLMISCVACISLFTVVCNTPFQKGKQFISPNKLIDFRVFPKGGGSPCHVCLSPQKKIFKKICPSPLSPPQGPRKIKEGDPPPPIKENCPPP